MAANPSIDFLISVYPVAIYTLSAFEISSKEVVQKLFDSYQVEEQAYKGCLSLLKLADKYSPERLENACRIALIRIPNPRYKNIRLILESSQDKEKDETPQFHSSSSTSNKYACVRGASYYKGGSHEE